VPTRGPSVGALRIIVPQDVKDVAGYVERALYSLDNASSHCMTLSLSTLGDYNTATNAIRAWLIAVQDVGWLTDDLSGLHAQGEAHAATLRTFYTRFAAEGCVVPGGTPAPPTRQPFLSSDNPALIPTGFFGQDLGWLAVAFLAFKYFESRR